MAAVSGLLFGATEEDEDDEEEDEDDEEEDDDEEEVAFVDLRAAFFDGLAVTALGAAVSLDVFGAVSNDPIVSPPKSSSL